MTRRMLQVPSRISTPCRRHTSSRLSPHSPRIHPAAHAYPLLSIFPPRAGPLAATARLERLVGLFEGAGKGRSAAAARTAEPPVAQVADAQSRMKLRIAIPGYTLFPVVRLTQHAIPVRSPFFACAHTPCALSLARTALGQATRRRRMRSPSLRRRSRDISRGAWMRRAASFRPCRCAMYNQANTP